MILFLHQGAIGDFLLTLPLIEAAKAAAHHARVEVIASAASARLAAGRSAVDIYTAPEQVGLHTLFGNRSDLDERLIRRFTQATMVLSFLGGPAEAVHRRLSAAASGLVISIDPRPDRETLVVGRHITEQWAAIARSQGLAGDPLRPAFINLQKAPGAAFAGVPNAVGTGKTAGKRVVVHPGSGGRSKCWPVERFMALADQIEGAAIAWMLGPAECEPGDDRFSVLHERIRRRGEELILEEDLLAAARRIAEADLFVGNDSGMTHLAATLGVRTLAVFTTTDPHVWRPLGDHVTVITPS